MNLTGAPRRPFGTLSISVLLAATGGLLTSSLASAADLPVIQATDTGWSHMSSRPGVIYVGQGGSPLVRHLSWGSWGGEGATTHSGQLVRMDSGCTEPTYLCPVSAKPVTVHVHDVQSHRGTAYFAKMRWTYTSRSGHAEAIYWLFTFYPGASMPAWQER